MGFSLTGLFVAISLLAPNLLMIIFPPINMPTELADAGVIFTVLERVGQVACVVLLVILKNNFSNRSIDIWFISAAFCIVAYYSLWVRYVVAGRDFSTLFSFMSIPIPMAILPIIAFALLSMWGKSIWLGLASTIFAVGHIANSWYTYNLIK